jgi:hypothetical protein
MRLRDVETAEQISFDALLAGGVETTEGQGLRLWWRWTGGTFASELPKAVRRYRDKFGREPCAVYVNAVEAKELQAVAMANGLTCRAAVNVLLGHFEIG